MELQMMEQLIGSVGFPIAAFLLIYYQQHRVLREITQALQELREEIARSGGDRR